MHHEEHVGKASAEVGAICVVMARGLGSVHVHALGTVRLDHGLAGHIGQAERQHWLVLTVDAWTHAEIARLVLFDHL